jgi:hypothetical protein
MHCGIYTEHDYRGLNQKPVKVSAWYRSLSLSLVNIILFVRLCNPVQRENHK